MTEVVIYESTAGSVEVRLERETVWLRQEQLAELFGRDRTVIGRHIRNVVKEGELDEATNVQNMHIPSSDKPVRRYSLDVIISVGYRIKSHEGVRFRQWANRVLREHLRQGYTINRDRFVVKNHPFTDGNKRSAAYLMVDFLSRNSRLMDDKGEPFINDNGLAALTGCFHDEYACRRFAAQ